MVISWSSATGSEIIAGVGAKSGWMIRFGGALDRSGGMVISRSDMEDCFFSCLSQ
jgi:hypothetical protein